MEWSVGVTTVPARAGVMLPRTLASLAAGGFDRPRLFVDGSDDVQSWKAMFRLPASCRWPRVKPFGNWVLALWELWLREPDADRWAIFQDDLVCVRNLRPYLESLEI